MKGGGKREIHHMASNPKLKSRAFREELMDGISRDNIEKTGVVMRWLKKMPRGDIEKIKQLLDENT